LVDLLELYDDTQTCKLQIQNVTSKQSLIIQGKQ